MWPLHSRTRGKIFPSDFGSDTGGKPGARSIVIGGGKSRTGLGGTGGKCKVSTREEKGNEKGDAPGDPH